MNKNILAVMILWEFDRSIRLSSMFYQNDKTIGDVGERPTISRLAGKDYKLFVFDIRSMRLNFVRGLCSWRVISIVDCNGIADRKYCTIKRFVD